MGFARSRTLAVTAGGLLNQTAFVSMKKGGMVTLSGTFVGTVTLQRRGANSQIVDATDNSASAITYTAPGTYTINPAEVQGEYRLNCKSGAYTSGTINMMIEGR